jgi:hypothetical protein
MEIVAGPLDWTAVDEENFAKFLDTETGKRLVPKLLECVPDLLSGGEINAILIRSGEVRSYRSMVSTLISLAHPAPKLHADEQRSEYPPLVDDAAWADGHKLDPNKPID